MAWVTCTNINFTFRSASKINTLNMEQNSNSDTPSYDRYVTAVKEGTDIFGSREFELPQVIAELIADFAVGLFVFEIPLFKSNVEDDPNDPKVLTEWSIHVIDKKNKMFWNNQNSVRSSRPLRHGCSFGVKPKGQQVSVGLLKYGAPTGNIRFRNDAFGVYLDAKMFHYGEKDAQSFSIKDKLQWDGKNRDDFLWLTLDETNNIVKFYYPRYAPIDIQIPEALRNQKLYPCVAVWNHCGAVLVHGKPKEKVPKVSNISQAQKQKTENTLTSPKSLSQRPLI